MNETIRAAVLDTPIGPLSLLTTTVDGAEALVGSGFTGDPASLHARLHASLADRPLEGAGDLGVFTKAHEAYFAGDLAALDDLPVHQPGTWRREALWAALRAVPAGVTISYADLAKRAGLPATAARAAGGACAKNLIAPVIPCHRILPSGGAHPTPYGNYYYGVERKQWLVEHERRSV